MAEIIAFLGSDVFKMILGLLLAVASIVLYKYLEKKKIEDAQNATDQGKIDDQTGIIQDNTGANDQAQADSNAVDDFLKPKP